MGTAALSGVFSFAVFPYDNPIKIFGAAITEGRVQPAQDTGRAHIRVLVEALADGEAQPPKSHVIGKIGSAHGPEIDGIKRAETVETVIGHHAAVITEKLRTPRKLLEAQPEAV
jgi:hypothetical protein